MSQEQLAECVERIDLLLAKVEELPDPDLRRDVQEIVQCLLDYHGLALARVLSVARNATGVLDELARDELVSSLLLLHGLHPADLTTRVLQALEQVRPFLQSHGGNVELVSIEGTTVHLRLGGHCHGCPSSMATLKSRIETAIFESAPDVEAIVVDDPTPKSDVAGGFVSLETLTIG